MGAVRQTREPRKFTPEEYLTLEENADYRSEYIHGEIYAMSGASFKHVIIATNIVAGLHAQLKGKPCRVLSVDMRVQSEHADFYTYPDIAIVCDKPEMDVRNTLKNPRVIIEILSPSTAAYDRNEKFSYYKNILSLEEYILIDQEKPFFESFRKTATGWLQTTATDVLRIETIDCLLKVEDVYDKTEI